MSIMRTKGQGNLVVNKNRFSGKAIITSTPISAGSWFTNYYQQNQNQKNLNIDSNRKLVIQNYSKDLGSAVFWGWDVIAADEMDDVYLFQLKHRENSKLRIYITLGRELQVSDLENNLFLMYQCYVHDDDGDWHETFWLDSDKLNYKSFWDRIETIADKHHPLLPF
jgi:hypothetical protein